MERICIACGVSGDRASNTDVKALCQAIKSEHVECVKTLVKAGVDVNSETEDYCEKLTVLDVAIRGKNTDILKTLIRAGATMNSCTMDNRIDFVVRTFQDKNTEHYNLPIDAGFDVHAALAITATNDFDQGMAWLIDNGADMNHQLEYCAPALFAAAKYCSIKCMKLLISKGAHVTCNIQQHWFPVPPFIPIQQTSEKPFLLLHAAGVDLGELTKLFLKVTCPPDEKMRLTHLC